MTLAKVLYTELRGQNETLRLIIGFLCLYHAIEKNTGNPFYIRRYNTRSSRRVLRSYSHRNFVGGDISSYFKCSVSHVRAKFFPRHYSFEVENSGVNEYLSDKTLLTDQEVDIFVEKQRNPRK